MRKLILKARRSKGGMTLVEIIVTMALSAIVMTSVAALLPSILRIYATANDMAERNTLLNNVANIVMADISNATKPISSFDSEATDTELVIQTATGQITYQIQRGILYKKVGTETESLSPVLSEGYYRNMAVSLKCEPLDPTSTGGNEGFEDAYTLTINVSNHKRAQSDLTREYVIAPLVLNTFVNQGVGGS